MKKVACYLHTRNGVKPVAAYAFRDDRLSGAMLIVHHPLDSRGDQTNSGWKVSEFTSGLGFCDGYTGTRKEIIDASILSAVKQLNGKSVISDAKLYLIARGLAYPLNDPKTFPEKVKENP